MFPDTKGQNPYAPLVTDKSGSAVMAGGSPITVNAPPMKQGNPLAEAQQMQGMASLADDKLGLGAGDMMQGALGNYKSGYDTAIKLAKAKELGYVTNAAQAAQAAPLVGWEAPLLAEGATAATTAAEMAAGAGTATQAGAAMGSAAGKGGSALAALGPIGIPLLIGGALYAASR